jgi:hypothetical protein
MGVRLTDEEREALVKDLRKRATSQKGLHPEQRKEARRLASNLEKVPLLREIAKKRREKKAKKPAHEVLVLPENSSVLNRLALQRLKEAKAEAPPHHLHLLNLAFWGLENRIEGEWPESDRPALEMQVGLLLGWKPANVVRWLTSNPNGPSRDEQENNLIDVLRRAESSKVAAAMMLLAIYQRQVALQSSA